MKRYTEEDIKAHKRCWNYAPSAILADAGVSMLNMSYAEITEHPLVVEHYAYLSWLQRHQMVEHKVHKCDTAYRMAPRPQLPKFTKDEGICTRNREQRIEPEFTKIIRTAALEEMAGKLHPKLSLAEDDSTEDHKTLVRWLDGVSYRTNKDIEEENDKWDF